MKFGEKIKLLRKKKKVSQTELGKLCGLSLRTIRNYEVYGRYPKQREVYSKLAAALGCSVNFLLSENEELELYEKKLLYVCDIETLKLSINDACDITIEFKYK